MTERDFEQVYLGCRDNVWGMVSKYVFSREDREDLFQEVFLRIHKALRRFRRESSVNTWVYKIAVNTALNHLKKRKRYQWGRKMLSRLRIIEEAEPQERMTDMQNLKPLEKLNPQQRMILLLAEVEEKKLNEVAEVMKVPLGTVKSNLHRAREILKKELKENA